MTVVLANSLDLAHMFVKPGSEALCGKPICCRAEYTDYTNVTAPASLWGNSLSSLMQNMIFNIFAGEYSCDTPLTMIESLLEFIPTAAPNIAFGIMTGDVPPHEVWSTLPTIKTQLIHDNSYNLLHTHFDSPYLINAMLYPAVGNHEAAPTNIFPLESSRIPIEQEREYLKLRWLYESLSESWQGWLPRHTISQIKRNSGSYVARPVKGLKIVSLNTNFCYTMNWWLYESPSEKASMDDIHSTPVVYGRDDTESSTGGLLRIRIISFHGSSRNSKSQKTWASVCGSLDTLHQVM